MKFPSKACRSKGARRMVIAQAKSQGRQNGSGNAEKYAVITGGAGFIGSNLADRLLSQGERVLVYDNLSRRGSEINLDWLAKKHGERLRYAQNDVRNLSALRAAVRDASSIFHFAAQVAVTDSIVDPASDFEVNAIGTLNVLEAARELAQPPRILFTSTNKVYGAMPGLALVKGSDGYRPASDELQRSGIGEDCPLDFCSPYGCSKGAADQYMLDYARTFGLPTTVFRMSCIYGPRQFGTEDQGWLAHFLICALKQQTITVYGDGWQVRDVLFVDDLIDALLLAREKVDETQANAFNIGGGPANVLSLRKLIDYMRQLYAGPFYVTFNDWRQADQRYYVSDTSKFHAATGWKAKVGVQDGVQRLFQWLVKQKVAATAPRTDSVIEFPRLPARWIPAPSVTTS
jgi:CDP-paratose 2-epimerase